MKGLFAVGGGCVVGTIVLLAVFVSIIYLFMHLPVIVSLILNLQ
jgi:hypothetical protein